MGSLPDSKYIIQTDGYYFVESHDVDPSKGYITVSAKGIANGLSDRPNDDCDFGPDTYNPDRTSGIPYTYTSGIQEAINYMSTSKVGILQLGAGVYDVSNAPVINGNKIQIPFIPTSTATFIPIKIVGAGFGNLNNVINGQTGIDITKEMLNGGSIIWDESTDTGTVFGMQSNISEDFSNFFVEMTDIVIFTKLNYMNGLSLKYAIGCKLGAVAISVSDNLYGYSDSPATGSSVGFNSPKSYTFYPNTIDYILINGYHYGFILEGGAVSANTVLLGANYNAMWIEGGLTPSFIQLLLDQSNDVTLQYNNSDSATLTIGEFSVNNQYLYSNLNVRIGTGTTYPTFTKINRISNYVSNPISNPFEFKFASPVSDFKLYLPDTMGLYGITYPAISVPTVPASGTAQQNTNPFSVNVYLYGGTVTVIDYTPSGGSATQVGTSGPATVRLNPGDSITLTYSAAPTWNWVAV